MISRSRVSLGRSITANAPRRNAAASSRRSSRCVRVRLITTVGGRVSNRCNNSSTRGPASDEPPSPGSRGSPRSTTAMCTGSRRITSEASRAEPAVNERTPKGSSSRGNDSTQTSLRHRAAESSRFRRCPAGVEGVGWLRTFCIEYRTRNKARAGPRQPVPAPPRSPGPHAKTPARCHANAQTKPGCQIGRANPPQPNPKPAPSRLQLGPRSRPSPTRNTMKSAARQGSVPPPPSLPPNPARLPSGPSPGPPRAGRRAIH